MVSGRVIIRSSAFVAAQMPRMWAALLRIIAAVGVSLQLKSSRGL